MTLRLGSLFSGAGGLDLAVEEVFGAETRWVSDIIARDKHGRQIGDAPRILAHRYPHAPNLGDITTVDWAGVERVDIIAGGSPCQDVSPQQASAAIRWCLYQLARVEALGGAA